MTAKIPFTLLACAVLAYACGPRARNESAVSRAEPARSEATRAQREQRAGRTGTPLAHTLDVTVGEDVRFAFAVTNETNKKLEVNFANGRTHDVVVLDSLGKEVWRWSEGRFFTQVVQNRVMRTSDSLRFEEEWSDPAPGRYVAVAMLASRNYPVEERVEFTVPK